MSNIANTSSTSDIFGEGEVTVESILHTKFLLEKYDRPAILIWRGPPLRSVYFPGESRVSSLREYGNLLEEPELRCCELLFDEDMVYIVAGIGIIAGRKIYPKLKALNLKLAWSDSFIDLDDQVLLFESLGLVKRRR